MSENYKHDLGQVLRLILGREKRLLNCSPGTGKGEGVQNPDDLADVICTGLGFITSHGLREIE